VAFIDALRCFDCAGDGATVDDGHWSQKGATRGGPSEGNLVIAAMALASGAVLDDSAARVAIWDSLRAICRSADGDPGKNMDTCDCRGLAGCANDEGSVGAGKPACPGNVLSRYDPSGWDGLDWTLRGQAAIDPVYGRDPAYGCGAVCGRYGPFGEDLSIPVPPGMGDRGIACLRSAAPLDYRRAGAGLYIETALIDCGGVGGCSVVVAVLDTARTAIGHAGGVAPAQRPNRTSFGDDELATAQRFPAAVGTATARGIWRAGACPA